MLVYTSEPLPSDTELTGPIVVTLYAATTAPDTDFTAKLLDVRPDGFAHNLQDGIVRARYRTSAREPSPITPGLVYRYDIDLWATSHVVQAGHRIRVDISQQQLPALRPQPEHGRCPRRGRPTRVGAPNYPSFRSVPVAHHPAGHPALTDDLALIGCSPFPEATPMTTQTSKPTTPAGEPDTPQSPKAHYWLDADRPGLPITLDLRPLLGGQTLAEIDIDIIWAFLEANELYAIEYDDAGHIIVMPPMYMPGGNLEAQLIADVTIWSRQIGGMTPSSSTIFRVPGVGGRGPDASWVSPERLAGLDAEQRRTGQICPDFVAEIRSASNSLVYLQRKMQEYLATGRTSGLAHRPAQSPSYPVPARPRAGSAGRPGNPLRRRRDARVRVPRQGADF